MANKKITVSSDNSDDSLSPEEEHALEVKIDKMLDPRPADQPKPKIPDTVQKKKPKSKNGIKVLVINDSTEDKQPDEVQPPDTAAEPEPEPETKTAPPLPKTLAKKVGITVKEHEEEPVPDLIPSEGEPEAGVEAEQEPVAAEEPAAESKDAPGSDLFSEELPKSSLDIAISGTEVSVAPEPDQPAETGQDADDTGLEEAVEDTPPVEDEPKPEAEARPEPIEEIAEPDKLPETDMDTEPAEPEGEPVKKYRPPDGPIQFKRAEPAAEPAATTEVTDEKLEEDAEALAKAFSPKPKRVRKGGRKKGWLLGLVIVVVLIIAVAVVPRIRAMALNLGGMHAALSVTIDDASTHLPLSGVSVQAGAVSAITDVSGKATLRDVKLGSQTLQLQKGAYSSISKPVLIAWKTAAFNDLTMQATGPHYVFTVTDYASGKPVGHLQASSGSALAEGDKAGHLVLAVDASEAKGGTATISALGYRASKVSLPSSSAQPVAVKLVSSIDDIYVARQAGRYNIDKVSIDGQGESQLLAGTGNETGDISLVASSGGGYAALVSKRDNVHDKAGYLLDTLSLINTSTGAATSVDYGQQIRIIGWFGDRLVYTRLGSDTTASDPTRYRLLSYSISAKKSIELDHGNNFNNVSVIAGVIYDATSNHISGGTSQLIRINPDGTGKQVLLTSEVTSILRISYTSLLFATSSSWYSYHLGDAKPSVTNSGYNGSSRLYVDSPDGQHSIWVDTSKGKLMLYTKATDSEVPLVSQSDVAYPVRWLTNDTIIYRASSSKETADYVVSVAGGNSQKITDVYDADGLTLW